MDRELWERIKPLFAEARELDAAAWDDFLAARCGPDDEMRRALRELLDGDRQAASFLESAAGALAGRSFGPYHLDHLLGEGGMGEVYLAHRDFEGFSRRVAFKVLKPGLVSTELVGRFRRERKMLAVLDHPAIAGFVDAGLTEGGLPYLVMEYVEGRPIDRACDARRMSIRQRLALFCQVCDAVHFAHRNLIVHRDLKPANILIKDDGSPKLLDFGIAKWLDPGLAPTTSGETVAGRRPLTPDFASPEQLRGEPVTTASDVYSLGVVLYALLSGRPPYRLTDASPVDWPRLIRETEPPRLSLAVGRDDAGARKVSAARGMDPAKLSRRLRGDLEDIVAMAMRKEPERRYPSAAELAADVRRHLEGRPVTASGDSLGYRLHKLVRRHRLGATALAAVLVSALAFSVVMAVQHARLARALEHEETVTRFLIDLFEVADPFTRTGETVSARAILDQGAERLSASLDVQPLTRARLLDVMGTIYRRLGLFERAAPLLETALGIRREALGEGHADVAVSLDHLGNLKLDQGDLAGARECFEEALSIQSSGPEGEALAETLNDLGKALHYAGDLKAAEPYYRRALAIRRRSLGDDHLAVAETLNNLAVVLWMQGDYEASEPLHREALATRRRLLGDGHVVVSESLNNLAALLRDKGELEAARVLYERALELRRTLLGDAHPRVGTALNNLAGVLHDEGDLAAAEPLYQEALAVYRQGLGEEHPHVAAVLRNLARLRADQGRAAEAESLYSESVAMLRRTVGPRHPLLGWSLTELAHLLQAQARGEEAEPLAREALGIFEAALPPDHWQTAVARCVLGGSLVDQGRPAEAEPLLRRGFEALEKSPSWQARGHLRCANDHLRRLRAERDETSFETSRVDN